MVENRREKYYLWEQTERMRKCGTETLLKGRWEMSIAKAIIYILYNSVMATVVNRIIEKW